jgi:hypothetical protein
MRPELDLFYLFRYALVLICTVYAALQIASSLWGWHRYLTPSRRETAVLRQYVILQLLRLRVRRFIPDVIQIVLLLGVLGYLVRLHHYG